MKIILISGKAEAGKTTTAKLISQHLWSDGVRSAIIPYGQYVKDTAKMIFGWNGVKDEAGRTMLQQWGTDKVRTKDPDFWLDTVERLARICEDTKVLDCIIIDDCRFLNEIDHWKSLVTWDYKTDAFEKAWPDVLTIRVERPGHENALTPEQRMHPSETSLDDYEMDIILTAKDFKELNDEIYTKLVATGLLSKKD